MIKKEFNRSQSGKVIARLFWALLLSGASGGSFASGQCTEGSEFEPPLCPLVIPKISKVVIIENAAGSATKQDITETCAEFRFKKSQVRRYFSKTKLTNANDAHHTLDWSPCYASGKLLFEDGSTGDWSISRFGSGSLSINGGERMVLYCPGCTFKPFG